MLVCYYNHFHKTQRNFICCLEFTIKYFFAMVMFDSFESILKLLNLMIGWPIFGLKQPVLGLKRLLSSDQIEFLVPFILFLL